MHLDTANNTPYSDAEFAKVGLEFYDNIMEKWGVTTQSERAKLLGDIAVSTYSDWRKKPPQKLSRDTLERISHYMGIYKALRILFDNDSQAHEWVNKPNKAPLFAGETALDRMKRGGIADLYEIRRFLDGWRGVW